MSCVDSGKVFAAGNDSLRPAADSVPVFSDNSGESAAPVGSSGLHFIAGCALKYAGGSDAAGIQSGKSDSRSIAYSGGLKPVGVSFAVAGGAGLCSIPDAKAKKFANADTVTELTVNAGTQSNGGGDARNPMKTVPFAVAVGADLRPTPDANAKNCAGADTVGALTVNGDPRSIAYAGGQRSVGAADLRPTADSRISADCGGAGTRAKTRRRQSLKPARFSRHPAALPLIRPRIAARGNLPVMFQIPRTIPESIPPMTSILAV